MRCMRTLAGRRLRRSLSRARRLRDVILLLLRYLPLLLRYLSLLLGCWPLLLRRLLWRWSGRGCGLSCRGSRLLLGVAGEAMRRKRNSN